MYRRSFLWTLFCAPLVRAFPALRGNHADVAFTPGSVGTRPALEKAVRNWLKESEAAHPVSLYGIPYYAPSVGERSWLSIPRSLVSFQTGEDGALVRHIKPPEASYEPDVIQGQVIVG